MKDAINRGLTHPRTIAILSVLAVLSLGLSMWVVIRFTQAQAERERDRIEADVEACERANRLRSQIIAVAHAQEAMVIDIIASVRSRNIDLPQFDPIFARYEDAIDDIDLVDCDAVTPGATPTSLEDP